LRPKSPSRTSPAITRRELIGTAVAATALPVEPSDAVSVTQKRAAPPGFLWGTAISAYQSEGNNTNADAWLMENIKPSMFKERSGDACDSYHRYREDFAVAAQLGFNCYRLGIEWARIEPSEGYFSNAELDHYTRVLETCRAQGLRPIVTLNHFTTPLWFTERGGFEVGDAPGLFARYCQKVIQRLGHLMHMATTFNEANIRLLVEMMPQFQAAMPLVKASLAAAARATNSPKFSRLAYADPKIATPLLQEAHRRGYDVMKSARPELPVGLTLTTQDIQASSPSLVARYRDRLYGDWIEVGRAHADFFGVQTYTRFVFDEHGMRPPPKGAELTLSGYEFYPQALANTIRWAHQAIGKPIYVTENGISTRDDRRRIAFIDKALDGVRQCVDEGVPVHSYIYWSLLDNFEWTSGYEVPFGLVAVDRTTFKRMLKPSAVYLGKRARANLL
jgi:beta-glucosidase